VRAGRPFGYIGGGDTATLGTAGATSWGRALGGGCACIGG
jgi:hypothetical protein